MSPNILLCCFVTLLAYGCTPEPHIKIDTSIPFTRMSDLPSHENEDSSNGSTSSYYTANTDANSLALNSFPFKQEELQGCYYSFTDEAATDSDGKYLFVKKNDGSAHIALPSGLRTLTLLSTTKKPNAYSTYADTGFTEVYRTGLYKVTLSMTFVEKTNSGGTLYKGTISVESYRGQKLVKHITGDTGC